MIADHRVLHVTEQISIYVQYIFVEYKELH
jgi:hypothetical protein